MINWKNASTSDQHLFTAIARLFRNNPQLLEFFFHSSEPQLAFPCKKIKQLARSLSSADELLVRMALDIWNGSGTIHFNEIHEKLDDHNFTNAILTLGYLRGDRMLHEFGQLKLDIFPENSRQLKTDIF
jgi:hypothetical protein